MIVANGNTYQVKEDLKKVGFTWNKNEKRFETENFNKNDWEVKYCKPSYNGRKAAAQCQSITFTEVEA